MVSRATVEECCEPRGAIVDEAAGRIEDATRTMTTAKGTIDIAFSNAYDLGTTKAGGVHR